jgi:hypothetical protein
MYPTNRIALAQVLRYVELTFRDRGHPSVFSALHIPFDF